MIAATTSVSTLSNWIPPNVVKALRFRGFTKLSQFLISEAVLSVRDLERATHLPSSDVNTLHDVLSHVFALTLNPSFRLLPSAADLYRSKPQSTLSFGAPALDIMLVGGLHTSSITEVAGAAGIGKTQVAIHAAVAAAAQQSDAVVVFVDSDGSAAPSRFLEIALAAVAALSKSMRRTLSRAATASRRISDRATEVELAAADVMSRIVIIRAGSVPELLAAVQLVAAAGEYYSTWSSGHLDVEQSPSHCAPPSQHGEVASRRFLDTDLSRNAPGPATQPATHEMHPHVMSQSASPSAPPCPPSRTPSHTRPDVSAARSLPIHADVSPSTLVPPQSPLAAASAHSTEVVGSTSCAAPDATMSSEGRAQRQGAIRHGAPPAPQSPIDAACSERSELADATSTDGSISGWFTKPQSISARSAPRTATRPDSTTPKTTIRGDGRYSAQRSAPRTVSSSDSGDDVITAAPPHSNEPPHSPRQSLHVLKQMNCIVPLGSVKTKDHQVATSFPKVGREQVGCSPTALEVASSDTRPDFVPSGMDADATQPLLDITNPLDDTDDDRVHDSDLTGREGEQDVAGRVDADSDDEHHEQQIEHHEQDDDRDEPDDDRQDDDRTQPFGDDGASEAFSALCAPLLTATTRSPPRAQGTKGNASTISRGATATQSFCRVPLSAATNGRSPTSGGAHSLSSSSSESEVETMRAPAPPRPPATALAHAAPTHPFSTMASTLAANNQRAQRLAASRRLRAAAHGALLGGVSMPTASAPAGGRRVSYTSDVGLAAGALLASSPPSLAAPSSTFAAVSSTGSAASHGGPTSARGPGASAAIGSWTSNVSHSTSRINGSGAPVSSAAALNAARASAQWTATGAAGGAAAGGGGVSRGPLGRTLAAARATARLTAAGAAAVADAAAAAAAAGANADAAAAASAADFGMNGSRAAAASAGPHVSATARARARRVGAASGGATAADPSGSSGGDPAAALLESQRAAAAALGLLTTAQPAARLGGCRDDDMTIMACEGGGVRRERVDDSDTDDVCSSASSSSGRSDLAAAQHSTVRSHAPQQGDTHARQGEEGVEDTPAVGASPPVDVDGCIPPTTCSTTPVLGALSPSPIITPASHSLSPPSPPQRQRVRRVACLVIDSVALPFSSDFGMWGALPLPTRSRLVHSLGRTLLRAARLFDAAVLVTNHVSKYATTSSRAAMLGAGWAHVVTHRLLLRPLLRAVDWGARGRPCESATAVLQVCSSPTIPAGAAALRVTAQGIDAPKEWVLE